MVIDYKLYFAFQFIMCLIDNNDSSPYDNLTLRKKRMQQLQLEPTSQINTIFNEFGKSFPVDQSMPLIHAFTNVDVLIQKQSMIIEEHNKDMNFFKTEFEDFKENHKNLKTEIKKDLLVELATKADISNLHGEVKEEISNLRGEVKEEISNLRGEVKEEISILRGEVKEEISNLRGELKEDISNLRGELKEDISNLRGEMYAGFEKLSGEIKNIQIWMKVVVFFAVAIVAMFSPNFLAILKYFKI
ncbi:hypothetical protein MHK_003067 [Candidatus Magnetomorum sp. HK-1]|nr:hypothetical protein MHK_003067 [Candidatus Magnetomorum sp. HK-1]